MEFKKQALTLMMGASLFLSSCSTLDVFGESDDPPLPGERVSVLELQKDLEPDNTALDAQGFVAPEPWNNEFWPQRGGYPNHAMQNLALNDGELKKIWSISIGQKATKSSPYSAQPILVGDKIYTIDTNLDVRAHNITSGETVWSTSVKPPAEDEVSIGGGLSFGEGLIFVTNGFAEISALDPNTGELNWRKTLPAPARSAPTILNKHVYIQMTDNQLLALDSTSGEEIWRYTGFRAESGLVGSSSPSASENMIVSAFSSGEFTGIDPATGAVLWSDSLAPRRRVGGISSVSDVTALPVIDRDLIFGIGFGNKMLAINSENGRRVWQRDIGSLETPWVAGNHVFVVTIDNKLIALGRETGSVSWVTDLKDIQRDESEYWTGPIMAGNRLILASSESQLVEVNPQDGTMIRKSRADSSVSIPPIIAGGVLYVLSNNGKLTAYK